MISYTPIQPKIISDTPGRLRLRIDPNHRQPEKIQNIANFLAAQPDITLVQTNVNYGSILIYHRGTAESVSHVQGALHDIGIIFRNNISEKTEIATAVNQGVFQLNQAFAQATDNVIDLRILLPLGLSILAIRQLMIKGPQLDLIPWYVLAWYAFDSFLKFNRQ